MRTFLFLSVFLFFSWNAAMAQAPALEATIKCNAPNPQCRKLLDAAAKARGYQAFVPDPDKPGQNKANPQTAKQFLEDALVDYLVDIAGGQTAMEAEVAARETGRKDIDDAFKRKPAPTPTPLPAAVRPVAAPKPTPTPKPRSTKQ